MDIKLVVFDMDDTLYLERSYVESGFRAVGEMLERDYRVPSFYAAAWKLFELGARGDIFDSVLGRASQPLPRDIVERCVGVYRDHEPRIELLDDSLALLRVCQARFQTGLVTDGPRNSQRAKIRSLNLNRLIQRIIVTDEHASGWPKPAPKAFEALQDWFDVRGTECLYIGDNPRKDFVAGHALGWRTVRVRRPEGLHCNVEMDTDAEFEVPDLTAESMAQIGLLNIREHDSKVVR